MQLKIFMTLASKVVAEVYMINYLMFLWQVEFWLANNLLLTLQGSRSLLYFIRHIKSIIALTYCLCRLFHLHRSRRHTYGTEINSHLFHLMSIPPLPHPSQWTCLNVESLSLMIYQCSWLVSNREIKNSKNIGYHIWTYTYLLYQRILEFKYSRKYHFSLTPRSIDNHEIKWNHRMYCQKIMKR